MLARYSVVDLDDAVNRAIEEEVVCAVLIAGADVFLDIRKAYYRA